MNPLQDALYKYSLHHCLNRQISDRYYKCRWP